MSTSPVTSPSQRSPSSDRRPRRATMFNRAAHWLGMRKTGDEDVRSGMPRKIAETAGDFFVPDDDTSQYDEIDLKRAQGIAEALVKEDDLRGASYSFCYSEQYTLSTFQLRQWEEAAACNVVPDVVVRELTDDPELIRVIMLGREMPIVKAGTLERLVEQLTSDEYCEPGFANQFLLTFTGFTDARTLCKMVLNRYKMREADEAQLKKVRTRIINVLKTWIKLKQNFFGHKGLEEMVRTFVIEQMPGTGFDLAATQLMNLLDKRGLDAQVERETMFSSPPPAVEMTLSSEYRLLNFSFWLLDLSAAEVARQLTVVEYDSFKSIRTEECLEQSWQGTKGVDRAPNIVRLIRRFNALSRWACFSVLYFADMRERAVIIERFITLAEELYKINNFNGLQEMLAGLQLSAVHRLKRSWECVSAKKKASFKSLTEIMSQKRNYSVYRKALHTASQPCIPYLGVYLTDLTFIEDGNKSKVEYAGKKLINFSKFAAVAAVIQNIQRYQDTPYNFTSNPIIQEVLLSEELPRLTEDELYQKSLVLEPRQQ